MRDHLRAGAPALGVSSEVTLVHAYDARWPDEFEREQRKLRGHLESLMTQIEHFGSTAVPRLVAKPLLDVAVGFADRGALGEARRRLEAAGYEDRGDRGDQGGIVMAKGPRSERTHILHLVRLTDPQWTRMAGIPRRAAIRSHPTY